MATKPVYLRKNILKRLTAAQDALNKGYSVIINEILQDNLENYVKRRLSAKASR